MAGPRVAAPAVPVVTAAGVRIHALTDRGLPSLDGGGCGHVQRLGQVELTGPLPVGTDPRQRRGAGGENGLPRSGLMRGRWLTSRAAAPETTAAACDVPLPL